MMKKKIEETVGSFASPACLLHELDINGTLVDPVQALDVSRWRNATRARLLKLRAALPLAYRSDQTQRMVLDLERIIADLSPTIVSLYWPIRAEPDFRSWMFSLFARGMRIALPVARSLQQPLVFRGWDPATPFARGLWNIPHPAEGAEVSPTLIIAPLLGFDRGCYRLGYGDGLFDRTLAVLKPKPLVIGAGYPEVALGSIFPQEHDIPMDWIVTGAGSPSRRAY